MSFFNNQFVSYTRTTSSSETVSVNLATLMPVGGYIQSMFCTTNAATVVASLNNTSTAQTVTFMDVKNAQYLKNGIISDFPFVYQSGLPLVLQFVSTGTAGQTITICISYVALTAANQLGFTTMTNYTSGVALYANLTANPVNLKSLFLYSASNAATSAIIEVTSGSNTCNITNTDWNLSTSPTLRLDVPGLILNPNDSITLSIPSSSATVGCVLSGNILQ